MLAQSVSVCTHRVFFAAFISMFPNPAAKLDIILILSDNLLIVFSSILSTIEERIPSQSLLNSTNSFCE